MTNTARKLLRYADQPLRLIAMPKTIDSDRTSPTEASPPLSEPATNPEASPSPIIPKAGKLPQLSEPIREASIDQLLRMYSAAQEREHDLLDPDGRLALLHDARSNRMKSEIVSELSAAIDKLAGQPIQQLSARVSRIAEKLLSVESKNEEQDRQLGDIRDELSNINSAITTIMLQQVASAAPERRLLEGKTILIVEDSEHLNRILTRMGRQHGANTMTATSFDEVRAVVAAAPAPPDLAIIDIRLGGDDGIDVATWLSEEHAVPLVRCLLMTGHLSERDQARAVAMRLQVLNKPFEFPDLLIALQDALVTPTATTEAPG